MIVHTILHLKSRGMHPTPTPAGPWEAGVLGVQHPREKSGGAQCAPLEMFMNPQNAWNSGEKAVI